MSSVWFTLTVSLSPLLLLSVAFEQKKVYGGGEINPLLIFACSCPVVTLPHRVSEAVSEKTPPGRSCKGAGGGGEGCKGTGRRLHCNTYARVTHHTRHSVVVAQVLEGSKFQPA